MKIRQENTGQHHVGEHLLQVLLCDADVIGSRTSDD